MTTKSYKSSNAYKNKSIIPKESVTCKQIVMDVKYLQKLNYFKKEFLMIHIANENISSPAYRSHLKAMGLLPGVPDYMILFEGGVAFIEIKRDKTCKMTKAQKIFTELLTVFNIPWICTYDKDKVIEFLTEVLDEKNEL